MYSKAKLAAACAGIFYFLTYVPYMYIAIREDVKGTMISSTAKTFAVCTLLSKKFFGFVCIFIQKCVMEKDYRTDMSSSVL